MLRSLLLCLFVSLAAPPLAAQDYPTRTITFICPFPAGGGTDILARMLAQELQDKLKQTVIVENRVGAGTVIAAQAVARSAPDGYTLFLAPVTTLAIGPSVYKSLPYDTVKDFAPIGLVGSAQFGARRQPVARRQHAAGADRDHQAQVRRAELRHLGRLDAASSVHGNVPQDDRRQGACTCPIAAACRR